MTSGFLESAPTAEPRRQPLRPDEVEVSDHKRTIEPGPRSLGWSDWIIRNPHSEIEFVAKLIE